MTAQQLEAFREIILNSFAHMRVNETSAKEIYERRAEIHMKKVIKLLSLLAIAAFTAAVVTVDGGETFAFEKTEDSFTEKELPVFKGKLTDETITVRFYDAAPHVPYIGIKEYYDCITADTLDKDDKPMSVKKEGNKYILKSSHGEAAVDTEKDIMTSENLRDFANIMCLMQAGLSDSYEDGIPYVRVKSTQASGEGSVKLDFSKYGINIFGDDGDVYFPESTLSDIFTDLVYHFSVCNGETFYFNCIDSCYNDNIAYIDPDYAVPIMAMLDDDLNRPEDLAQFAYSELCFSFDHFYGLPGKAPLNDELMEKGLEQALMDYGEEGEKTIELLKSRNYAEYLVGLDKLQLFVGDGGHTKVNYGTLANAVTDQLLEKKDSITEELKPLFDNIQAEADKVSERYNYYQQRTKLRDDAYKGEKYIKEGDTAVYVLDSFMGFDIQKWDKYYKENGAKPSVLTMRNDDILLINECMKDAEADPEIKNFVIDCSNNRGGSIDEVAMLYCLVTGEREVTFHMENCLTGQKISETYEADLNFDRKFDEKDKQEPYDLKFAVLTSVNSFSCGNIFPSVMKDAGYLIMGEQSGGGTCAVLVQTTGEGMTYRVSAYKGRMLNAAGENIDNGVEVDVDLIPKRSNGEPRYITVKDIPDGEDGATVEKRTPDYSDFYNIERLSDEMNKR